MKLSRRDAAAHLGISIATLDRWIRKGKLQATYGEPNRLGKRLVFIDFPEIPQPTPEPVEVSPEPEPEPKPLAVTTERPVSNVLLKQLEDQAFAEAFLQSEASDSAGNTISGHNVCFSRPQTLIGVAEPQPRERLSTTSHMDAALVSSPGPSANDQYLNSLEYALACGRITRETYDAMTGNASKARIPEQVRKEIVDKQAIYAAFRHGYSR